MRKPIQLSSLLTNPNYLCEITPMTWLSNQIYFSSQSFGMCSKISPCKPHSLLVLFCLQYFQELDFDDNKVTLLFLEAFNSVCFLKQPHSIESSFQTKVLPLALPNNFFFLFHMFNNFNAFFIYELFEFLSSMKPHTFTIQKNLKLSRSRIT